MIHMIRCVLTDLTQTKHFHNRCKNFQQYVAIPNLVILFLLVYQLSLKKKTRVGGGNDVPDEGSGLFHFQDFSRDIFLQDYHITNRRHQFSKEIVVLADDGKIVKGGSHGFVLEREGEHICM